MTLRRNCWFIRTGLSSLALLWVFGFWGEVTPWKRVEGRSGVAIAQTSERLADAGALPATKPVTVMVEGEPQAVTLQLYEQAGVPLVTYYPAAMRTWGQPSFFSCPLKPLWLRM